MENQAPVQTQAPAPQAAPESASPSFAVPEPYQSKDWAKGIKSADDLWKLTDNAQSLIGKRPAGIPAADAPDAEWNKFYDALGRPESPDKYQFSDIEGIPEGLDLGGIKQKAAQILHEAGIPQKQADKVFQKFIAAELEAAGKTKESWEAKQKELDAEFDKLAKDTFGDKYDSAAKAAQDLIVKYVPEGIRGAYEEVSQNPKALTAVIAALNGAHQEIAEIKRKYGAEDKLNSGTQTASASIDDVRKELAQLRTSQAARDFTHIDNKKTMARIDELAGMVQRHYNK
jgi:hypothetical protein